MGNIIYKTKPHGTIILIMSVGCILFAFLTYQLWPARHNWADPSAWVIQGCCAAISLFCLGCIFSLKVVTLKHNMLVFKHILLPIRKTIALEDVKLIYHETVKVEHYKLDHTTFVLSNDKRIKMADISKEDFEALNRLFKKLKKGNYRAD